MAEFKKASDTRNFKKRVKSGAVVGRNAIVLLTFLVFKHCSV
jgi:hypothetical protein